MPEPMFDATQVRHIKINNWRKQISSAIFYVRVMLGNKPGEMVVIISTVNETDVHWNFDASLIPSFENMVCGICWDDNVPHTD